LQKEDNLLYTMRPPEAGVKVVACSYSKAPYLRGHLVKRLSNKPGIPPWTVSKRNLFREKQIWEVNREN